MDEKKLKTLAKKIDDSFHNTIVFVEKQGLMDVGNDLRKYQSDVFNYLNEELSGKHPNKKYYDKPNVEGKVDFLKRL